MVALLFRTGNKIFFAAGNLQGKTAIKQNDSLDDSAKTKNATNQKYPSPLKKNNKTEFTIGLLKEE